jgi:hypothetical protein
MAIRDSIGLHADCLDADADALEAAGIGLHPTRGHVAILRRMSNSMRSDAAQGRNPYEWHDGAGVYASGDPPEAPPLPRQVLDSLRAAGIDPDVKVSLAQLDAAMTKAEIARLDRISVKTELLRAGWLG